jgi:hypothetical protein
VIAHQPPFAYVETAFGVTTLPLSCHRKAAVHPYRRATDA